VKIRISAEANMIPETSTVFSVCGGALKLLEDFFDKALAV